MVLNKLKQQLSLLIIVDEMPVVAWKQKLVETIRKSSFSKLAGVLVIPKNKKGANNRVQQIHMSLDRFYFRPTPDAFALSQKNWTDYNIPVQKYTEQEEININFTYALSLSDQAISNNLASKLTVPIISLVHSSKNTFDSQNYGYKGFLEKKETLSSAIVCYHKGKYKLIERTWSMLQTMSLSISRNEHFWKLSVLLKRTIKKLSTLEYSDQIINSWIDLPSTVSDESNIVSTKKSIQGLVQHVIRFGIKVKRKISHKEQWILLLKMNDGISKDFNQFKKILPPKEVFWADPFLVEKGDQQFLFFEELPFATDKGHLSVAEVDKKGNLSEAVKILDLPYHLSYPFIFNFEDRFYMIPESYEAKNIQVFEAKSFPYKWEHKMDLMTDVMAFDTTLFFYKDKWWMFTAIAEEGSGHNDELFLFFADTPFTEHWTSHPQNPIVSDVRKARPAGNIYIENGKIIRPSQDCSQKYGYGFHLNEIEVLTEKEYKERSILHVRPTWDKALTRTHSFNHSSTATVIDAAIQRPRF